MARPVKALDLDHAGADPEMGGFQLAGITAAHSTAESLLGS